MHGLAQIAVCTNDIASTIRTYVEVLGFDNAGGRPRWGEYVSRVQELPSGDDASCMMWWLIGEQEFVQIELFHHTNPPQRPRREEWKPSDLGWTRFGVYVPDFDATLERLERAGLTTITAPMGEAGARRVCFREPHGDTIIELFESHPEGRDVPATRAAPRITYAAASVSDLDATRAYLGGAFGCLELPADTIHGAEHESLWDLSGARSERGVFRAGDVLVEISRYLDPVPRDPAPDALLSDQGIMNIAFGYRDRAEVIRAHRAALALGATATMSVPEISGGMYLRMNDLLSLELLLVPAELDSSYGFTFQELSAAGSIYAVDS